MTKATLSERVSNISSVREKIAARPSSDRLLGRTDAMIRELDRLASRQSRPVAA